MQLISLEHLRQLVPTTAEADISNLGAGFTFKEAIAKYKNASSIAKSTGTTSWRDKAYAQMQPYLRTKCPPIKLVGEGSSRTAYACIGGKCLKLAKSDAGAAQNEQECKYTMKRLFRRSYSCFAQTYDKESTYGLLLSECCAQVKDEDELAKALGLDDLDVFKVAMSCIKSNDKKLEPFDIVTTKLQDLATKYSHEAKRLPMYKKYAEKTEKAMSWINELATSTSLLPGQKIVLEIYKFWKKNGINELLPADLIAPDNWGFAIRNGQLAPIVLDAGFSDAVASKYYHL